MVDDRSGDGRAVSFVEEVNSVTNCLYEDHVESKVT